MNDEMIKINERLESIEKRNSRVESDKGWETSKTRIFFICLITYLVAITYIKIANIANAYFGALVPVIGFYLSTLSLPLVKRIWLRTLKNTCSSLNIRLATPKDLNGINVLFRKVIDDLENNKKLNMWNSVYPFCEFEKDIKNKGMYIIESKNKIVGSFTIDDYDDPECHVINWESNNKKWFYLSRLVILPSEQGKGYAKIAMKFIDDFAIENNYEVIRLTVYEDNKSAIGLYEKLDFVRIENSHMVIQGKIFIGFEKRVRK